MNAFSKIYNAEFIEMDKAMSVCLILVMKVFYLCGQDDDVIQNFWKVPLHW